MHKRIVIGLFVSIIVMVISSPVFAAYETSLKGYWAFNETSGVTAYDSTTNANSGTTSGATVGVAGKFGKAYSFDGSNDYVNIPDTSNYATNTISVAFWLKSTQVWSGTYWPGSATLVSKGTAGGASSDWTIISGSTVSGANQGKVMVGVGPAGWGDDVLTVSNNGLNDGAWHHLVWTRTGGTNVLYADGTLAQTTYDNGGSITNTRPIQIGGDQYLSIYGSSYLNGLMDDVAIWNRALNVNEIIQVKNFGVEAFEYLSVDLGYDTTEMASLYNIYSQQSGTVTLDGTLWQYTSASLDGHNIGDAWAEGDKYYIKLGSGLEGEPLGGAVPEPATVFTIIGGLAMAAYRRVCKRSRIGNRGSRIEMKG